jgi:hypothetical protein
MAGCGRWAGLAVWGAVGGCGRRAVLNSSTRTHPPSTCFLNRSGGVDSVDDPVFQRVWRDTFLIHPTLRVPWKVILGNHDYQVPSLPC